MEKVPVPTIWLYGKTGSGKTSIVHYLTGASNAEIGNGYRPCTQHSRLYSFPDDELPLVHFLDTRGLGEIGYDAVEDWETASESSQLVIVTTRVSDHANDEVIEPLRKIRVSRPHRPVLLVLTCLHDAYPGEQHPHPDPFDAEEASLPDHPPVNIPEELNRSIDAQCARWKGLFDQVIAIDLTLPYEGFEQPEFGGERLKRAIIGLLPAAYRQTLIEMDKLSGSFTSVHQQRASRIILAHSITAASAAAVPVPWIDIPFVLGIQSHLAHRLAAMNSHKLDAKTLANVTAALGGRVALRMGIREALKIIPWVGTVANAAAAFALTYATGWAWSWYFQQVSQGQVPSSEELRSVYREQLERATALWRRTHHRNDDA